MKRVLPLGLLILSLLGWRCSGGGGDYDDRRSEENGPTPEQTVRLFQGYMDKNLFDEAKKLCTPNEQKRLTALVDELNGSYLDSTVLHTKFLELDCTVEDRTAYCFCRVEDEYEQYEMEYILVRRSGRWLIDIPENSGVPETDKIVDDVLQSL